MTSRGVTPVPPTEIDQIDAADDGGVQRVADLDLVGRDDHDPVDDEAGLAEQFGDHRTAVVLFVSMRRPVVDDDDECATHQLTWLFHERNRISRRRRGASHPELRATRRDRHCWPFRG